jgi:hypothetical protein
MPFDTDDPFPPGGFRANPPHVMTSLPHVLLHVVPEFVGIPSAPRQQVLQPVRAVVTGVLGQPPAVLAAVRAQQAPDVIPYPAPHLDPAEPSAHPQEQILEFGTPASRDEIRRMPRTCTYRPTVHDGFPEPAPEAPSARYARKKTSDQREW